MFLFDDRLRLTSTTTRSHQLELFGAFYIAFYLTQSQWLIIYCNITRRLDLLFNNRYMLDIDESNSKQYVVKLVIPINP